MPLKNYRWFIEYFSAEEGHLHGIRQVLFSKETPFQSVDILELGSYGKALVLDGRIQSTSKDEFIYHETLVHPAMLCHPEPRRVFIVGGGEGATLREVLRHRSVQHALMVDIDEEVVARCRELLPEWHQGAFEDPRTDLRYLDAQVPGGASGPLRVIRHLRVIESRPTCCHQGSTRSARPPVPRR
jgi:spermidine synthase